MLFSFKTYLYQVFIDPLLLPLQKSVLMHVEPSHRVIDVACGPGALAMAIAQKARHVTGIDLSDENIAAAKRLARRRGIENVFFEVRDASNLSYYADKEFDIAITSMAVHQFNAHLAVKILTEMKRIARKVIIADYNHHMPRGWGRSLALAIERMAGGDHYNNFRTYMQLGGIHYFSRHSGITLNTEVIRGGGVFIVALGDSRASD
jgi:SAM-dependent methyltransferase